MFRSARLRLTAWYLLIIMLVSTAFSVVLYRDLIGEVERFARAQQVRIERRYYDEYPGFPIPPPVITFDLDLVAEARQRIIVTLLLVNGTIFLLAGGLGYILAGKTLEPIKEMMDEQNRFISDASHEFRTPLTALKSMIEVNLRDRHLTLREARRVLAESIDETDKLQLLSDGLLRLAQFQKPAGIMHFQKIPLSKPIRYAIAKIQTIADTRHVRIADNTAEYEIEGNAASLAELFIILLDNAVKYSHDGGTVSVSDTVSDGSVTISVRDTGIGIDEKDLPHIFDRFYRSDTARSKPLTGGYGLGLSIAKNIVAAHHGSIGVESRIQNGTVFSVRLPAVQRQTAMKLALFR